MSKPMTRPGIRLTNQSRRSTSGLAGDRYKIRGWGKVGPKFTYLTRGGEDELLLAGRGVDEWFGIPSFFGIVSIGPYDTETRRANNGRLHIMGRQVARLGKVGIDDLVGGC